MSDTLCPKCSSDNNRCVDSRPHRLGRRRRRRCAACGHRWSTLEMPLDGVPNLDRTDTALEMLTRLIQDASNARDVLAAGDVDAKAVTAASDVDGQRAFGQVFLQIPVAVDSAGRWVAHGWSDHEGTSCTSDHNWSCLTEGLSGVCRLHLVNVMVELARPRHTPAGDVVTQLMQVDLADNDDLADVQDVLPGP